MPKALIIYFSQGKTTKKISNSISKGLATEGFIVDLYDITQDLPPEVTNYDMVGIGSPVYIFRPPFNVMAFLKNIPNLNGMPFFCFILHGTLPGVAGNIIREHLTLKGGKEIGYAKFKGADYFLGYIQRGVLFSPDNPNETDMDNARQFGQEVAGRLTERKYEKPGMDSMPGIVYSIEELITKEFFIKYMYSYLFKLDKEKCDLCSVCLHKCPNNNISLNKNGHPQWGRDCLFCLYCQMKCPKDAIKSVVDWPIMAPFMSYNVSQSLNNSMIEHVSVEHSKGRTKRI